MTTTTETLPFDAEAWAWGLLSSLGGIHLFTVDSTRTVGYWVTSEVLQVDVRASSKAKARERAQTATNLLLHSQFEAPPAGGVITKVEVVTGPAWLPDPDGAPRYVVRVRVDHHPA